MPFVMEKRSHPRLPTKLALKYRLLRDSPPRVKHGQSIDLSEGGISFRSFEFMPHKAPVLVEFTPPDKGHPIRFVSEVVHAREHSTGNHFVIGMQFEHLLI
jgi:hypothetical protein